MPQVVVIAGPNGAGKTIVSKTLLSEILHSKAFVNMDAIAQGLNGLAPDTQAFQAGRLMLQQLDEFANAGEDFAFETTLSGRTFAAWLRKLREEGDQVFLFDSWLNRADLAVERVRLRVQTGGHSIPEPTFGCGMSAVGTTSCGTINRLPMNGESWIIRIAPGINSRPKGLRQRARLSMHRKRGHSFPKDQRHDPTHSSHRTKETRNATG
jgi:hypothetical protein